MKQMLFVATRRCRGRGGVIESLITLTGGLGHFMEGTIFVVSRKVNRKSANNFPC